VSLNPFILHQPFPAMSQQPEEKAFLHVKEEDFDSPLPSPLPSPISTPAPRPSKPKLSASAIIPVWIVLSSSVIIYNNYLYNTLQFRYPVFLVTWHLAFAVRFSCSWF
jgi:hypothetical protein